MKKAMVLHIIGLSLITTTLYAAGDLIVTGKAGIGTPTPVDKLDVVGNVHLSAGSTIYGDGATYIRSGVGGILHLGSNNLNSQMVINNSSIGIGTTAPESKLHIVGNGAYGIIYRTSNNATNNFYLHEGGTGYIRANSWIYGSDRRLKENIEYFESGLDKIQRLKPAKFDYVAGQKRQYGFIAQDVQEVIPDVVSVVDEQTGLLGLKTTALIPYLVNAIKEQQKQIEQQRKDIEQLKAALSAK